MFIAALIQLIAKKPVKSYKSMDVVRWLEYLLYMQKS